MNSKLAKKIRKAVKIIASTQVENDGSTRYEFIDHHTYKNGHTKQVILNENCDRVEYKLMKKGLKDRRSINTAGIRSTLDETDLKFQIEFQKLAMIKDPGDDPEDLIDKFFYHLDAKEKADFKQWLKNL